MIVAPALEESVVAAVVAGRYVLDPFRSGISGDKEHMVEAAVVHHLTQRPALKGGTILVKDPLDPYSAVRP